MGTAADESLSGAIGPINLDAKCAGKRSAGNPHAAFEAAGAGNGPTVYPTRARRGKPWIQTRDRPEGHRASPRPYRGAPVAKLLGERKHAALVVTLREFLQSYNPHDAYRRIETWAPDYDEAEDED